jgi:hypothetical protein
VSAADDWLLHRVRLRGGIEGVVVAVATQPTLTVRTDHGAQGHHTLSAVEADLGKVEEVDIPVAHWPRLDPTNRLEDHLLALDRAIQTIAAPGQDDPEDTLVVNLLVAKSHVLLAIEMGKGTLRA